MNIKIFGDAYVITSSIKVNDLILLQKEKPSALKMYDEDKNEKFAIGYKQSKPCITEFSVTFGGVSKDGKGYATITGSIPECISTPSEAKKYVASTLSSSVVDYIKGFEESIPDEVKAIKASAQALLDSIVVDGADEAENNDAE